MLCHSRVKLSQIDSGDRFWQTRVKCYYERSCTGRGYSANCRTQRQQMQLSTARVNVKSILICHDCKSEMKELIWYHIWAFGCVTTAVLTCPNWRKGKSLTSQTIFPVPWQELVYKRCETRVGDQSCINIQNGRIFPTLHPNARIIH